VEFLSSGIPLRTVNDLPPYTPIVPIYYYIRDLECAFYSLNLTMPQFRRLNLCRDCRLIVWNLWGPDELGPRPLIMILLEDLCPTDA